MHALIAEATRLLLTSSAFRPALDKVYANFIKNSTITFTDVNGLSVPATINRALELPDSFAEVLTCDPPRSIPGPHPKGYVYHVQSEYPPREQEEHVRKGYHRMGVSVYGTGETPQEAELVTELLGSTVVSLIEGNQYVFAQLPGASGASSVAYVENEVSGQKLSGNVSPFHLIYVVILYEQR